MADHKYIVCYGIKSITHSLFSLGKSVKEPVGIVVIWLECRNLNKGGKNTIIFNF